MIAEPALELKFIWEEVASPFEKPLVSLALLGSLLLVIRLFGRRLVLFLCLPCLRSCVLIRTGPLVLRMSNRSRMLLLLHSLRCLLLCWRCLLVFRTCGRSRPLLLHRVLNRRSLPYGHGLCVLRGRLVLRSRLLS